MEDLWVVVEDKEMEVHMNLLQGKMESTTTLVDLTGETEEEGEVDPVRSLLVLGILLLGLVIWSPASNLLTLLFRP